MGSTSSRTGYIENDAPRKAIDLYNQVQNPSDVMIVLLLNACAQMENDEALALVEKVNSNMSRPSRSNVYVITSMLDALMKCGELNKAQTLFDATTNRDMSMYAAMMAGEFGMLLLSSVPFLVLLRLHEERSTEKSNRAVH